MHGHHTRMMRHRIGMRRHPGACPPFGGRGRGRGRGAMMGDFLNTNPDCAEKMLRYGIDQMRDADFSDAEIRAYVEEMHGCGHFDDVDIDSILS